MTLQKTPRTLIKGTGLSHSRKPRRKSLAHLVEKVYPLTYTVPLRAKVCRSHHRIGHPLLATTIAIITTIRVISLITSPMTKLLILILTLILTLIPTLTLILILILTFSLILILNYLKLTNPAPHTGSNHQIPRYYTCLLLILSHRAMNPPLRRISSNKKDHSTSTFTTKKSIDHLHHR